MLSLSSCLSWLIFKLSTCVSNCLCCHYTQGFNSGDCLRLHWAHHSIACQYRATYRVVVERADLWSDFKPRFAIWLSFSLWTAHKSGEIFNKLMWSMLTSPCGGWCCGAAGAVAAAIYDLCEQLNDSQQMCTTKVISSAYKNMWIYIWERCVCVTLMNKCWARCASLELLLTQIFEML